MRKRNGRKRWRRRKRAGGIKANELAFGHGTIIIVIINYSVPPMYYICQEIKCSRLRFMVLSSIVLPIISIIALQSLIFAITHYPGNHIRPSEINVLIHLNNSYSLIFS